MTPDASFDTSDFPEISDHGVIGDGRALALIDRTGTITSRKG